MRETATYSPYVPHERIANAASSLGEERNFALQNPRSLQHRMCRPRANDNAAPLIANFSDTWNVSKIDQVSGLRESKLHQREQAVPAGNQFRLLSVLAQERDCVLQ